MYKVCSLVDRRDTQRTKLSIDHSFKSFEVEVEVLVILVVT